MKIYEFYSNRGSHLTHDFAEYNISGEDYAELIRTCFQYSAAVSFYFIPCGEDGVPAEFKNKLEPFHIKRPDNIVYEGIEEEEEYGVKYYRTCPELCDIMLGIANSILDWVQLQDHLNPENPTFYRSDGSLFFDSVIHEGRLQLTIREDEDVSHIVSVNGWEDVTERDLGSRYVFYDRPEDDIDTESKFDICGDDYKELINTCCKYCIVFSLVFIHSKNAAPKIKTELTPFCIDRPDNIPPSFYELAENIGENKYYRVCKGTQSILLETEKSIFGWAQKRDAAPVKLTFYRADGSVFLITDFFMGEIELTPRENEDVSRLVSLEGWEDISRF